MPKQPPPHGKCALCLESAVLQHSHIIPEWLYKPLYDKTHKFTQVYADAGQHHAYHQKGLREYLLCHRCEQQFSRYEAYGVGSLHGGQGVTAHRDGAELHLKNLNYRKFKLLQLSILWRASVSTLPSFKDVKLGPHQEMLRRMLCDEDPGPSHKYGCLILIPWFEGEVVDDLIVAPTEGKCDGMAIWRFVFTGMAWLYAVSNRRPSKEICDQFLQENNTAIMRYFDVNNMGFIIGGIKHLIKLGKIPKFMVTLAEQYRQD